jgi:dephospho-CoA kinase
MIRVGITGLIGAGKSYISGLFHDIYQVKIFNSDLEAKKVVLQPEVRSQIIQLLGAESFAGESYNTKFVGGKVFNDPNLKNKLDNIIHPVVYNQLNHFFNINQKEPYVMIESALMIQTGYYINLDKLCIIKADVPTRERRVLNRDTSRTRSEFLKINALQETGIPAKLWKPTFQIKNTDSPILKQIHYCHKWLLGGLG